MAEVTKVGIIACSGEEIPAGTISRLATRRVLESLRPQSTVTLCLPLFLAGEEQERRFARQHPTITVDGCDKLCAKRGTETYSGQVACSLNLDGDPGRSVDWLPSFAAGLRQGRRAGHLDRGRTDRRGGGRIAGHRTAADPRESGGQHLWLCLQSSIGGWDVEDRRQDGRHQWPAAHFRPTAQEGSGPRQRLLPTNCWRPFASTMPSNLARKGPIVRPWSAATKSSASEE